MSITQLASFPSFTSVGFFSLVVQLMLPRSPSVGKQLDSINKEVPGSGWVYEHVCGGFSRLPVDVERQTQPTVVLTIPYAGTRPV